jgi:primary-amine oxidase
MQCWFYLRLGDHPDLNYYAYPLDLCAEVNEDLKVTKVYRLPLSPDERINTEQRPFDHDRIHPAAASEYHPDLRPSPRTTTKPYQVVQPEGPSFSIEGQKVSWEKWSFRVGFNYREGLTLHDIHYDGRSLFYRLSLAEMFVPYGDPRAPYPRKAAFDLGNDGAGINANNLRLGCDCLGMLSVKARSCPSNDADHIPTHAGTIKYFDAWHNDSKGSPIKLPNVVCCHEQDDGILWKHTNFRTQNAVVARSRILVLQTIITVSNYEYVFAFHFAQDASLSFEVRATGILSTAPAETNPSQATPYGTRVAPGVLAPYHQHLFSLRIDPAIDGHANTLVIEESVPLAIDDLDVHNDYSIGYTTTSTAVENESGHDLDHTTNRSFNIVNENKLNPTTRSPVGFKLLPSYSQLLLAHPRSFHARRSEFAQHAVWVTRYQDDELFPAGTHTMQSMGGEGIASAIERRRKEAGGGGGEASLTRARDIVIWHTFGSTHNPRIEDWPVMPCEKMTVGLKPVNFFEGNPGIDVAPSRQEVNRSVLYAGEAVGDDEGCCEGRS